MRVIDCDWKKRNGNGQSTCHLCNRLTWDSWCFDFELKILDKELFNTVLCDDCISKIKKELECKMSSNEEIIEEKPKHIEELIEEKPKHIEELIKLNNVANSSDLVALSQMQWENNSHVERKINELTKALNYLLDKDK